MDAVVGADDLRKSYEGTPALAGVSLEVRRGEVLGLIGPNGAGKTTLVRCLTGTVDPDGGAATLLGAPPADVDRERIGLLPQSFSPPARLTARELVGYYAGLYEEARDPDAVLSAVGLDERDARYENLSGGQQRRVCVATAVVNDPEVLFLDEPTTGIDPAGRRSVWRVLDDLVAAGTTVVLTTHDMAEAERLADRVGLLADGRLAETGPPSELVATHGGESTLVVETDAAPDALAGSGFAVRNGDDGLTVEGVDPAAIGDVVRALDAAGVEFDALSWREPDLEDVYLALAGETDAAGAEDEEVRPR